MDSAHAGIFWGPIRGGAGDVVVDLDRPGEEGCERSLNRVVMAGASDTRVLSVRGAAGPDGAAEHSARESGGRKGATRMTPTRAFVFAGDPTDFTV